MKNRALIAASSVISFFSKLVGQLFAPSGGEKVSFQQEAIEVCSASEPPPVGSGLFMKWLSDEHPGLVRSTSPARARVYNYRDYQAGPPGLRLYAES